MLKALIRTIVFVGAVLVAAQFVPFVAEHEQGLVIGAIAIGLIGVVARVVLIVLALAALAFFVYPFVAPYFF